MTKNKHIGPSLEDFLREDGILEEVDARVQKRILADQLRAAMKKRSISESAMAVAMKTSRSVVRALLDPESKSAANLTTLAKAAHAVGMELRVALSTPQKRAKTGRKVAKKSVSRRRAAASV